MSYVNGLDDGIVVWCDCCTSPIKNVYFTHSCEYRTTRINNGINPKKYCYDCLINKKDCKYCKQSYMIKSSVSI